MLAVNRTKQQSFFADVLARAMAIAACAAFWWLWLTLVLAVILAIAGSTRRLDVSPSTIVAALALLAILLLIGGLLLIQPVFARVHTAAMTLLTFLARHRRSIAASIGRTSIWLLKATVVVALVVASAGVYVATLWTGMTLTVMTADQLERLPVELGPDAIVPWFVTFARMYIAVGLLAACVAVGYVLATRRMPRLSRERT